jgi:FkbM family methyltransferase
MLISLKQSIAKHDLRITGVVHVGAHFGQEYHDYKAAGIRQVLFIEPCEKAFKVLQETFNNTSGVMLFNGACGAEVSVAKMNVEQANQGMSNSLLKPAKHLQQYPSIQFTSIEEVEVHPLDNIVYFLVPRGNLLVMDVQGFELEVLKGATQTLKQVDYIYTEVNRDEVYENCARVEQLDEYLTDFARVETSWQGGTWGDAWYIRKSLLK